jgi:hypothetical protein
MWSALISPRIPQEFLFTMKRCSSKPFAPVILQRELNHLMPFSYFRNMTDEDLKSIFAFLQSVKPVKHYMDNSEPPTYCRLCRQNHGFGDKN